MKKQIFNKSLPFANLLILTLVSNVNAGNYLFHTVIDAPALSVGNALTGARFSYAAGLTNPARINQFKPGTFLFSSESRFSGTLNRQIFAYRRLSFPLKILFLHVFTDGRDASPNKGVSEIQKLQGYIKKFVKDVDKEYK